MMVKLTIAFRLCHSFPFQVLHGISIKRREQVVTEVQEGVKSVVFQSHDFPEEEDEKKLNEKIRD